MPRNRAVARLALFDKPADYEAFERVLAEAIQKYPTRLLGYCVMPNHWHLVLWPREEGWKKAASPLAPFMEVNRGARRGDAPSSPSLNRQTRTLNSQLRDIEQANGKQHDRRQKQDREQHAACPHAVSADVFHRI